MKTRPILFCGCLLLLSAAAQAVPVNRLDGHVVPLEKLNSFGRGPITQQPSIVWKSTASTSSFGYGGAFDFHGNGRWSGPPLMANVEEDIATMEYSFDPPVSGVGGLINYVPDEKITTGKPVIAIFDSEHRLIESQTLHFISLDGRGEFHGFTQPTPRIAYFSLSNSFIGLRSLTILTPVRPRTACKDAPQADPKRAPCPKKQALPAKPEINQATLQPQSINVK